MRIVLYSTGCPKCNVLKNKLSEQGIEYTEVTDVDTMLSLGITHVPVLSVDGEAFDFREAVDWVKHRQGENE